jgi:isopentenyl-diphosphate Delta-isomerase
MNETPDTQQRKADHIRICLDENVQFKTTTGLEKYHFTHCCLPELDYESIDLGTSFMGKKLATPFLISSMTGGTTQAQTINQQLALAAQAYGLAMGVGSQRVAIEQPGAADTFSVRKLAPDILLLANLGAVQLNYGYGVEECLKAIDLLQADALILHINPLQECIQPRGDRNFGGLLTKIEQVCKSLPVPVINAGVQAIDVAGAGGTSWALVEGERAENALQKQLGQTFANWGIPTANCIQGIHQAYPQLPLIASGGLRNGLDAAKSIALGADLAGLTLPFLRSATVSEAALAETVETLLAELKTALFCTGSKDLAALKRSGVLVKTAINS